ncbi:MAG: tRNA (N6-isopentenyl adenosine(37)-C2)-methylthiotransferase MiaB [Rickettsiales bacterium]|jgi:tRNA-2-methylthio-N6-dimethylallyladenosine synthase|nr:tRNA (N6-isopentenyl adenosine(37)-C2)-methylthiotransferase MiaB [Rickettsiales bacterium]
MKNKTFHIKSFGCQMNAYDSKRIAGMLRDHGYAEAESESAADAIILNTCYVRSKAAEKVFSELGRINKALALQNRTAAIAVVGCLAKAEGENIFRRAPYVSIVLSSQKYHRLPELLEQALAQHSRSIDTGLSGLEKFASLPPVSRSDKSAFLQIQEGCDQFCTYCSVPYTRGREVSRSVADVMEEACSLNRLGALEINLVGQNVNAYDGAGEDGRRSDLASLIRKIARLPNVRRIRYTTSYPSRMSDELIALHAGEPKLMPLLYLPIQSGSNRILRLMNRKYTRESYLELISKIKAAQLAARISSDFIVGFPGETDEDFEETMSIAKQAGFIQSFPFKYSARPGTPAAAMVGQIPEDIKKRRLAALQKLLRASQDEFNKSCVGRVMEVLFSEAAKDGRIIGRNEYQQPVIARAEAGIIGTIQKVKIKAGSYANLTGEIA